MRPHSCRPRLISAPGVIFTHKLLKISALGASARWLRLQPPRGQLNSSADLRWPSSRPRAQAHGFFDQKGLPIFLLLGGHSSFTHQELWFGSIDPLALSCFETNIPSLMLWGHSSCLKVELQQLWVFGGRGPHGELSNSIHCISMLPSPKLDRINSLNPAPPPRYRHAAAMDGIFMVVFGGVVHLGSAFRPKQKYDSTVAVFDTQALTWHIPDIAAGPRPSSRCDHTLTRIHEGVFLMMFGCLEDDDKPCNEVWELKSGAVWSWRQINCSGVPLAGLFAHSAICWNKCVVIFGGMKAARTGKRVAFCNDFSILDTVTWHHYPILSHSPPSSRCGHVCALFRNIMVCVSAFVYLCSFQW